MNVFVFVHDGQPLLAPEKCEVGEYDVIVQRADVELLPQRRGTLDE